MSRALLAVVVIAAGVTTLVTHHHKRPGVAHPQRPVDLRASRSHVREPLPAVQSRTVHDKGVPMLRVLSRSARPASDSGILSDVTMYCATGSRNADGRWPELGDVAVMDRSIPFGTRVLIDGNTYTVRDWIGSGSEFDIFGGNDASCERRALDYGRRRVHVVVHR